MIRKSYTRTVRRTHCSNRIFQTCLFTVDFALRWRCLCAALLLKSFLVPISGRKNSSSFTRTLSCVCRFEWMISLKYFRSERNFVRYSSTALCKFEKNNYSVKLKDKHFFLCQRKIFCFLLTSIQIECFIHFDTNSIPQFCLPFEIITTFI